MHARSQQKIKSPQPTVSSEIAAIHATEKEENFEVSFQKNAGRIDVSDRIETTGGKKSANDHADTMRLLMHRFNKMAVYPATTFLLQPKLSVSTPGDEYEQEADAVADKIMQMHNTGATGRISSSVNIIQRTCETCGKEERNEEEDKKEDKEEDVPVQRMIQRKCATCEEEEKKAIQRKKSGHNTPVVSNAVKQILQSSGEPLNKGARSFMESRLGFDFSRVKIYNNSLAHQSAKDINALAYTHRNNIVFGAGQYQPETESGKKLLAHELTHTIQQSGDDIQRKEEKAPEQTTEAKFIIEDDQSPAEGIMTKSVFLATLNEAVCTTVDQELTGTPYSSDNCPYIRSLFARQANSSPAQIEQLAARYEPRTVSARSAEDLINLILLRVKTAVGQWKQGKSIEDLVGDVPGMPAGGPGNNAPGKGSDAQASVQFKANPGGAKSKQSPRSVMQSLGEGIPLDSRTRSRMEGAFESDFSNVKVHTDNHAANFTGNMNARAFTVGNHIAFSQGEHRPGTLIGDALMAHELAHVMQQNNAIFTTTNHVDDQRLEDDANNTAVGVITKIITGKDILPKKGNTKLKSGLKLSSCQPKKSPRQVEIERLSGLQSGFLEDKRKKLEADKQQAADEAAKKSGGPKVKVKVDINDTIQEEASKPLFIKGPADPWEKDISAADRDNYIKVRVPKAWAAIIASIKGTELEKVMTGITPDFQPKIALEQGWYAWGQGNKKMGFGMAFIHDAEADPKNVWPVLAHEMGGHEEYGKTYASEIMDDVISKLPKDQQDIWRKDKAQEFANRYTYPETEIYSALRQRRYSDPLKGPKPTYGGLAPEVNIPDKLDRIKDSLQPEVAKAVLQELKRRIDANPEILERDKKYFLSQVKLKFGYDL